MRSLGSIVVPALLLLHGLSPSDGQNLGCIETINDIALRESLVSDTSFQREYTLCGLTVFEIGTIDFDYRLQDGQAMLPLRPNMKIKCGLDGKRENSCVIFGGDVQVDGTFHYGLSKGRSLDNIEFEGVTFFSTTKHNVWLTQPGSITFKDCEFRENTRAITPVLLDYYDSENPTRELSVTFDGCSFAENKYFGMPAHPALIVGNSRQNRLVIEDTRFFDNNMKTVFNTTTTNAPDTYRSFLVETSGPLTMIRNCFAHNEIGVSPVAVYGGEHIFLDNFQNFSAGDVCPFVSNYETDDQFDEDMPRCSQFQISGVGAECQITTGPTASPTEVPTGQPTQSPTYWPTVFPTLFPTHTPTVSPTSSPTKAPTDFPTVTTAPSFSTPKPTASPTLAPTGEPTVSPTSTPVNKPTTAPIVGTSPAVPAPATPEIPPDDFPFSLQLTSPPTNAPVGAAVIPFQSASSRCAPFWIATCIAFLMYA